MDFEGFGFMAAPPLASLLSGFERPTEIIVFNFNGEFLILPIFKSI